MSTLAELLKKGTETLQAASIEEAPLDAWLLMEYCFQIDRGHYLLVAGDGNYPLHPDQVASYEEMIRRRAGHMPVQYLTHEQNFCGLDFYVDEHVLIPRQDTEVLVETVLNHRHSGGRLLDVCTGSGCILLSLMALGNFTEGLGIDLSPEALAVARRNELQNQGALKGPVTWLESDMFTGLDERQQFDVLVSNPPYITAEEMEELMPEVGDHEPHMALYGPENGLKFYRILAEEGRKYLKAGGHIYYEIGCRQAASVSAILQENGYADIRVIQDLAGLDRVVEAVVIKEKL